MYTSVLCQTFNHFWNLSRCCTAAGGIAFAVLLFREAGEEGERKEERKRYIQMLRWLLFTPLLFSISPLFPSSLLSSLSTKVCLIHKGLIAITAAAPSSVCLGFLCWALHPSSHTLQKGERPQQWASSLRPYHPLFNSVLYSSLPFIPNHFISPFLSPTIVMHK